MGVAASSDVGSDVNESDVAKVQPMLKVCDVSPTALRSLVN